MTSTFLPSTTPPAPLPGMARKSSGFGKAMPLFGHAPDHADGDWMLGAALDGGRKTKKGRFVEVAQATRHRSPRIDPR